MEDRSTSVMAEPRRKPPLTILHQWTFKFADNVCGL
jgi:hypothetical protein